VRIEISLHNDPIQYDNHHFQCNTNIVLKVPVTILYRIVMYWKLNPYFEIIIKNQIVTSIQNTWGLYYKTLYGCNYCHIIISWSVCHCQSRVANAPGACIIKLITAVIYGFRNKLECLSLNPRLGWKGLPGTNILA
jgi:hypothetical protein